MSCPGHETDGGTAALGHVMGKHGEDGRAGR